MLRLHVSNADFESGLWQAGKIRAVLDLSTIKRLRFSNEWRSVYSFVQALVWLF